MTSFFADDNISERARAAGKSATEYLREAAAKRKAKVYPAQRRVWTDQMSENEPRRQIDLYRALLEESREEVAREQWRRSWLYMCLAIMQTRSQEAIAKDTRGRTTMRAILAQVSSQTGYSVTLLCSAHRGRALVQARRFVMWRARNETKLSLPQIGRKIGGRDHSTILVGVRKFQSALDSGEPWAVMLAGQGE